MTPDNYSRLAMLSEAEELEERERNLALLSFLPETRSLTIYCHRTGEPIANMNLLVQAGKLPYLSQWHDSVAYHPLFSLPQAQLLAWTRKNWNFLFRNTVDRSSPAQRKQFCVAFMAILHSMNCIKQDAGVRALPSFHCVSAHMQRLLELAYWYNWLDSKRFRFPTLRISKLNTNISEDLIDYLTICESRKVDYETSKEAKNEEAKLEAARRAEKAVRGSHVRAISKRMLWNWFTASMQDSNSRKYQLEEWVTWRQDAEKLWLASESAQLQYTLDEVNSIEEVFLADCGLGSSVSFAFRTELNKIRENIRNHQRIFEIDWVATMNVSGSNIQRVDKQGQLLSTPIAPEHPGVEPQQRNFHNKIDYLRASAKWKVAMMQWKAWSELPNNMNKEIIDEPLTHSDNTDDDGDSESGPDIEDVQGISDTGEDDDQQ